MPSFCPQTLLLWLIIILVRLRLALISGRRFSLIHFLTFGKNKVLHRGLGVPLFNSKLTDWPPGSLQQLALPSWLQLGPICFCFPWFFTFPMLLVKMKTPTLPLSPSIFVLLTTSYLCRNTSSNYFITLEKMVNNVVILHELI